MRPSKQWRADRVERTLKSQMRRRRRAKMEDYIHFALDANHTDHSYLMLAAIVIIEGTGGGDLESEPASFLENDCRQ